MAVKHFFYLNSLVLNFFIIDQHMDTKKLLDSSV